MPGLSPRTHVLAYRITGGRFGGRSGAVPIGLLTTTGRRSGRPRTTPLACFPDGDAHVVVASANGSDRHPDWYLNLSADPGVMLQLGARRSRMQAQAVTGATKARIWADVVARAPGYQAMQDRTSRDIPVVLLSHARD